MKILIQLIGFIAWFVLTLSYWQKNKKALLITQIIAQMLYSTHFYLLDGASGTICNFVGIIGLILIYIKEKINKPCYSFIILILILYILAGFYTYDGLISMLPIVACLIQLFSAYISSMKITKIGGIISAMCWFVYGVSVLSYSSMVTEVILIISTIISLNKKKVRG